MRGFLGQCGRVGMSVYSGLYIIIIIIMLLLKYTLVS